MRLVWTLWILGLFLVAGNFEATRRPQQTLGGMEFFQSGLSKELLDPLLLADLPVTKAVRGIDVVYLAAVMISFLAKVVAWHSFEGSVFHTYSRVAYGRCWDGKPLSYDRMDSK